MGEKVVHGMAPAPRSPTRFGLDGNCIQRGDPVPRTTQQAKKTPLAVRGMHAPHDRSSDLDVQGLQDCYPEDDRGEEEGEQDTEGATREVSQITRGVGEGNGVDRRIS